MRQPRSCLRALRLLGGQKDEQVRIAAPEPRNQLPIAQNHLGIGRAREQPRRGFRIFFGNRQDRASAAPNHRGWPDRSRPTAQTPASPAAAQCATGAADPPRPAAQTALRPGRHKIAAANAAALFKSLEHVVDRAESARHIFRRNRFAQQHAVAVEQLQRERMTGLGRGRSLSLPFCARIGKQRPAALRCGRSGPARTENHSGLQPPRRARALGPGDVRAQRMQRIVGDEAAPDQAPQRLDGLARIAAADA
jgi:hypothetical protein